MAKNDQINATIRQAEKEILRKDQTRQMDRQALDKEAKETAKKIIKAEEKSMMTFDEYQQ